MTPDKKRKLEMWKATNRLQRAIYRAISKPGLTKKQIVDRAARILLHAEKIGWVNFE